MRKGILVAGLAIAAASISGCQSTNPDFNSAVSSTGGGGTTTTGGTGTTGTGTTGTTGTGTTGTGTTGATGTGTTSTSSSTFSPGDSSSSQTGTPAITSLASGDHALAFNSSGQSPNQGGLIQLSPNASGVVVAVDDATGGALLWPEPIDVPFYRTGTNRGNAASNYDATDVQNHSLLKGANTSASYGEFRKIDGEADAELQVWSYDHSYIGQYRVWRGGNSPDGQNLAVFHGGNKTAEGNLPATATYTGRMGATATTANWSARERTVPDIDARDPTVTFDQTPILDASGNPVLDSSGNPTFNTVAADIDPNGEWRVTADANLTADFGAGTVRGSFNNTVWKKWIGTADASSDANGYTTVYNAQEVNSPFPDSYTIRANIDGADYTGSVQADGGYVQGNNHIAGSFYGPNGEETAGVFFNEATAPHPTDGDGPYERNGRGYVNIRGVFQGSQ